MGYIILHTFKHLLDKFQKPSNRTRNHRLKRNISDTGLKLIFMSLSFRCICLICLREALGSVLD